MIANKPIASHNANPKSPIWNNLFSNKGLRLNAIINPEKRIPIPAPAPTTPIVANPAPINLAAVVIVKKKVVDIFKIKEKIKF